MDARESQLRWNRNGRLAPSQRLVLAAGRPARWLSTLALLAVAGWLLGALLRLERFVPSLIAVLLVALAGAFLAGVPWLRRVRDALAGVALCVEGDVVAGVQDGLLGRRRLLSVAGRRLEAPRGPLAGGLQRVYFAPRSGAVLAMEPLAGE